ncbi:MAG: fibronectin type III domain-containing protein, partial [Caldilineaceae bacterium]|nr:fibronectin type III domain-containing protein [Caldilineaceae bacterium]
MATPAPMIPRRVQVAICVLGALVAAWTLLFMLSTTTSATPAAVPVAQTADACTSLAGDALADCNALVSLYTDTQGDQWFTSTNWLTTTPGVTYCDWYGVTCEDGRVTRLALSRNHLTGALPPSIGQLKALTHLAVDGNRLRGRVSPGICTLRNTLQEVNLAYNALETVNTRIRQCLDHLDPDWADTQTLAPRRIEISAITTDSISLSWQPIPYTADGGGHQVSFTTSITEDYTIHGQTADKSATGYVLDNLTPGQTYYVRIHTVTPAHAANPDLVRSEAVLRMAVTEADDDILLIVYAAFDNDLSEYSVDIVDRIRGGTLVNPNVRAVVLV